MGAATVVWKRETANKPVRPIMNIPFAFPIPFRQDQIKPRPLRPTPFKEVSELVEQYRIFWEQALHRFEAYLRATAGEEKKQKKEEKRRRRRGGR